jgi:GTP pyrophosphokinase
MDNLNKIIAIFEEQKRDAAELETVKKAHIFAEKVHRGVNRVSGEPYIEHPLRVAAYLAAMRMPSKVVVAGLLHDTIRDTALNLDEIKNDFKNLFGEDILTLVEQVNKLRFTQKTTAVQKNEKNDRYIENLRKSFVAFAADIRALIIKFSDRLDNLSDLHVLPAEKQKRVSFETLEIYAPIAKRLGMANFHVELEDTAFKYALPEEYAKVIHLIGEKYRSREGYLDKVAAKIKQQLDAAGIESIISMQARTKHLFSIYQKLQKYDQNINNIWDIFAVRIIAENIPDCYAAMGVIHSIWKPVKGRVKDYIAQPKPNGYRSLHTTVFCDDGEFVEFQIRTREMHDEAQYGIAAHWRYDENKGGQNKTSARALNWVNELASIHKEIDNNKQFLETVEHLKIDFFNDRIFVYTPKGDVIDLPEGATPIDFAYAIHTDIGNKATNAIVNNKNTALNTPLKSGDIVRIIIDKNRKGPSSDWLKFVKTNMARDHIKSSARSSLANFLAIIKSKGKKQ